MIQNDAGFVHIRKSVTGKLIYCSGIVVCIQIPTFAIMMFKEIYKFSVQFFTGLVCLHFSSFCLAQEPARCHTVEYMNQLEKKDPFLSERLMRYETKFQKWIETTKQSGSVKERIVPVVIHIIWHKNYENLCDAIIHSQIDILNEDYSRLNADTGNTPDVFKHLGEDSGIRFVLANRDPDGNVTTGIIRSYHDKPIFNFGSDMKFDSTGGQDQWDPDRYLNIWVCNLAGSVLGYATLPGTSNPGEDGIVISTKSFGRDSYDPSGKYNQGRTTTHELGHWLNLTHIWGDDGGGCNGSDGVSDTPNQGDATYGCPDFPDVSCSNGPEGNMFMNYMDYTDDRCMNIFTAKQNQKMQYALDSLRSSVLFSNGYVPDSIQNPSKITGEIVVAPNPFSSTFEIRIKLKKVSSLTIDVFDFMGKLMFEKKIENCYCENYQVNMSAYSRGIYFARIATENETVVTKLFLSK